MKQKKFYMKCAITSEAFIPSEYVMACSPINTILNAIPICAIPGEDAYKIGDIITNSDGKYIDNENPYGDNASTVDRTHGSCGKETGSIKIGGSTGTEPNGKDITDLKIGDMIGPSIKGINLTNSIGTERRWTALTPGYYYKATWSSFDGSYTYDHYGALKVEGYTNRNFS